jgi:hypothetical protein
LPNKSVEKEKGTKTAFSVAGRTSIHSNTQTSGVDFISPEKTLVSNRIIVQVLW